MEYILSDAEVRVLGCLMEKKMTTPEYYPLTLNSLLNACNQKSNRNPVVSYDENVVQTVLDVLKEKRLVSHSQLSRVIKFSENLAVDSKLVLRELAVLCILFLRGPQTLGEIKSRTERMCEFKNPDDVFKELKELEDLGFVKHLQRQPGQKEARFTHLFSNMSEEQKKPDEEKIITQTEETEKILKLEEKLKVLRLDLDVLRKEFVDFKNQF